MVKNSSLSILFILGINILSAQNLDSLLLSKLFTIDPINMNGFSFNEDTIYIINKTSSADFASHGKQFLHVNKEKADILSKKRRILVIKIESFEIEINCVSFIVTIGGLSPTKRKKHLKFVELFSIRKLGCCFDVESNKFEIIPLD